MSTATDRFLVAYKNYEAAVRQQGEDPRAVEEAAGDALQNRLRICRQIRNFLSHNNEPGFIEPTTKMMRFLDVQTKDWSSRGDIVRKHLKKDLVAADSDRCLDIYTQCRKMKTLLVPVLRGDSWALLSVLDIASAALEKKTAKIKDVKPVKDKPVLIGPNEPYSVVQGTPHAFWICVDKDKFLGSVIPAASREG